MYIRFPSLESELGLILTEGSDILDTGLCTKLE
jgi:hypothetical protein